MHRRELLSIGTAVLISASGCTNDDFDEDSTSSPNENSTNESDLNENNTEDCPTIGHLNVYIVNGTPEDVTIINASESKITDSKYIEKALSEANEEYKTNKENDVSEDSDGSLGEKLVTIDSEEMADTGDVEKIVGYDKHTYVKYDGKIFALLYIESTC